MAPDQRNLANTVQARGWRGSGRLQPCKGWACWEWYVKQGLRGPGHSWRIGDQGDPNDRCYGCGKTRRQLMQYEAPAGSAAHLERALQTGA